MQVSGATDEFKARGMERRALLQTMAALVATTASAWGHASNDWPNKPVNLVVPFPAGGGTDTFARPFSAQFAKVAGKTLVIDNRGGAGGTLGASIAAKAAPDGYNFFMGGTHHVIAPSVYPKLEYDLERDFVPLALLASVPQVLVVNPKNVPFNTVQELLADMRSKPGKYSYGSAGPGSSHHLAGELFKLQTKTNILHIPYKGAGPALQDLIAGNVDMVFDGLGSSAQHIKSGRIKALMVAGAQRNPAFPDVPSAAECGLPDYTVSTWYGLWAPKGTSEAAQQHMLDEVRKIGSSDDIKAAWAKNGAEYGKLNQQQFAAMVRAEIQRWAQVVKASGVKIDS
ncbi:Bug family tripartite tricarboxylate transporter substrate binding protein [Comamonas sp.]|jgi:tripartite-type tricarboxylate transporter receptor subunit TctC|uniref:Bug family tripartite tricarboxylate transporter substrate binding protein n=1 Tax=Comamonas sp. TaxID=34028 RepID=UPI0035DAF998